MAFFVSLFEKKEVARVSTRLGCADLRRSSESGEVEVVTTRKIKAKYVKLTSLFVKVCDIVAKGEIFSARVGYQLSNDYCFLPVEYSIFVHSVRFEEAMGAFGDAPGLLELSQLIADPLIRSRISADAYHQTKRLESCFRRLETERPTLRIEWPSSLRLGDSNFFMTRQGVVLPAQRVACSARSTKSLRAGGGLLSHGSEEALARLFAHCVELPRDTSGAREGALCARTMLIISPIRRVSLWRNIAAGYPTLNLLNMASGVTERALRTNRVAIVSARYLQNRRCVGSTLIHPTEFGPAAGLPEPAYAIESARSRLFASRRNEELDPDQRLPPWAVHWSCVIVDEPDLLRTDLSLRSWYAVEQIIKEISAGAVWTHILEPNVSSVDKMINFTVDGGEMHSIVDWDARVRAALASRLVEWIPRRARPQARRQRAHRVALSEGEIRRYRENVARGDSHRRLAWRACLPDADPTNVLRFVVVNRTELQALESTGSFFDLQRRSILEDRASARCSICMERLCNTLLTCGHMLCYECAGSDSLALCPLCRVPIQEPMKLVAGADGRERIMVYGSKVCSVAGEVDDQQTLVLCNFPDVQRIIARAFGSKSLIHLGDTESTRAVIRSMEACAKAGSVVIVASVGNLRGIVLPHVRRTILIHPVRCSRSLHDLRKATPNSEEEITIVSKDTAEAAADVDAALTDV